MQPPLTLANPGNRINAYGDGVSLQLQPANASSAVRFSAANLPQGLNLNPTSGLISGTFSIPPSAGGSSLSVTVTATDGAQSASQQFTWGEAPEPPVSLQTIAAQLNEAGDGIFLHLLAGNPGGLPLTFLASGLPSGLSLNAATGLISGTLTTASATPYGVTATVTDGVTSASQTFSWSVSSVQLTNPGDQTNYDGDAVSLPIQLQVVSPLPMTVGVTGLPAGLTFNAQTETIAGTIAATADANGPYTVTVTASDGVRQVAQTFRWNVAPVPAPTLAAPGDQVNAAGDVVDLQLSGSDPNGLAVTYAVAGLPDGLSADAATGEITGTFADDAAGTTPYQVTATLSNGTTSVSQTFH